MNESIPVVGAPSNARYSRSEGAARAGDASRRPTATSVARHPGADVRVNTNDLRRNIRAIQREARIEPERTIAAVTRNLNRAAIGLLQ